LWDSTRRATPARAGPASNTSTIELKPGTELVLKVEDLAFGGRGVARHEGLVLFIEGALPGESARVRVRRIRSGFAEAELLQIVNRSPDRAVPPCDHYGECGGCDLQHLSPEGQGRAKREQVRSILTRIAGIGSPPVAETVISADAWAYRFRIDFEWSRAGRGLRLGLHRRGKADEIVPIDRCHLISERANRFARHLAAAASRRGLTAWDHRKRSGFLRRASIQDARGSGEMLLTLETGRGEPQALRQLADDLRGEFPRLAGVVRREIDRGGRQVEVSIVSGRDHLFEIVDGDRFMIPAGAFFQPNVHLSGTLRSMALSALDPDPGEALLELFCGVGFLTRSLAPRVREMTAVEGSREAVTAARANLAGASLGRVRFLSGDVAMLLPDLLKQSTWDAIVLDPPRTGLPRGVPERIAAAGIGRLVYVSCDPATLARDLKIVMAGDAYRLIAVAPIDLFPQTHHVECVASLVRTS